MGEIQTQLSTPTQHKTRAYERAVALSLSPLTTPTVWMIQNHHTCHLLYSVGKVIAGQHRVERKMGPHTLPFDAMGHALSIRGHLNSRTDWAEGKTRSSLFASQCGKRGAFVCCWKNQPNVSSWRDDWMLHLIRIGFLRDLWICREQRSKCCRASVRIISEEISKICASY